MSGAPLELGEIQGNVVRGYGMSHARYLFVDLWSANAARELIGALLPGVTTSAQRPPDSTLNVAVTYAGLVRLGLGEDRLAGFPPEFREGMRARAEDVLGDSGESNPDRWERGEAHLLLLLHGRSERALAERAGLVRAAIAAGGNGLEIAAEQAASIRGSREHFGFKDGFGQPAIDGAPLAGRDGDGYRGEGVPVGSRGWRPVRAGEFVLGYEDEDGVTVDLPAAPLGRNSTFMVYRKLRQDVDAFRELVRSGADAGLGSEDEVAAKIVGRWADGNPLLGPDAPADLPRDRRRPIVNDFRYAEDPHGLRCPLGAHIRRANPRDGMFGGGERTKRHRIVRRGMPYSDGDENGLVFICFNASIARQFEVVQGWLNDGDVFHLGAEHDLVAGSPGEEAPGTMTVQGHTPAYLRPPRPLTATRGGDYLFYPSISALRALGQGTL